MRFCVSVRVRTKSIATENRRCGLLWLVLLVVLFWEAPAIAAGFQWHEETGFRWAELPAEPPGKPGFTRLLPDQTGLYFTNRVSERAIAGNRILAGGSGVAVGDFDNDGLPDIFLCALDGHCALYRNLGGFKFQDVTAASGIVCTNYVCRGAVFADINGDGWPDLLVGTMGHGVLVFTNKHDGTFADISGSAGLLSDHCAATLALADVDGNGTLDVYVADYKSFSLQDRADATLLVVNGQLEVPPRLKDEVTTAHNQAFIYGEPGQLYLNDSHGNFSPVSWTNGAFLDEAGKPLTVAPKDWGNGAQFHDVNGDGAPDLYVCDDFWTPDRFWINDGHGHFRAVPKTTLRHTSATSMGVDFADLDHDGYEDFIVSDMVSRSWSKRKHQDLGEMSYLFSPGAEDPPQETRNTLFHNRGDGTFEEIAAFAGVAEAEWSWQPVFLDVDLDGWDDILVIAGFFRDVQDRDAAAKAMELERAKRLVPPKIGPDGHEIERSKQEHLTEGLLRNNSMREPLTGPIVAFRNLGKPGLQFQDFGLQWGLTDPGIRTGIALGDLDGRGKLDLVVNGFNGPAEIYRNNVTAPRVAVRVKGLAPNTQGIGAKIKLFNGAVPMQSAEVKSGGLYLSGSDPARVFAAGQSQSMALEVTWRSGKVSTVREVRPNRIYELEEAGASSVKPAPPVQPLKPLFEDVSSLIGHRYQEADFDDFQIQPLLPRRLSCDGPGVAWVSCDTNGHEALVIGSPRGKRLEAFAAEGNGRFVRLESALTNADDLTSIVGWIQPNGAPFWVVGQASYGIRGALPSGWVFSCNSNRLEPIANFPGQRASTGPLAVADVYGDGHLDVFVGGRVIPGHYPEAASSKIYRDDGKQLVLDLENTRALENVGLVCGAVWSDLDGDGFPDLILACEWGPIRVFKNQKGQLHQITKELGLDQYTGWWRGVTTGDIDGDGRLDIIAANWGLNSDYQASAQHPVGLYYGDFSDSGVDDLIETVYDPLLNAVVPMRDRSAMAVAFPFFVTAFPTHKEYSEASIEKVLAALPKAASRVEATTLASTVFFNRTNGFQAVPLPYPAQLAPAFGVNVADFDGDGNEDIFLSQNFFQGRPDQPRQDAGRGLLLRGLGGGKLEAMPGQESGIIIYGEQRGSAVGDFNGDGRVDLAVAQNGGETKLFKNMGAKPGLSVRLTGPPGNPHAIGATIRLEFGQRFGPAREIHGGSGYWSQDSVVQVLGCPEPPTKVWIRWPGGKITESDLPNGAAKVTIDERGKVIDSSASAEHAGSH
jgi:hypothetical protein